MRLRNVPKRSQLFPADFVLRVVRFFDGVASMKLELGIGDSCFGVIVSDVSCFSVACATSSGGSDVPSFSCSNDGSSFVFLFLRCLRDFFRALPRLPHLLFLQTERCKEMNLQSYVLNHATL